MPEWQNDSLATSRRTVTRLRFRGKPDLAEVRRSLQLERLPPGWTRAVAEVTAAQVGEGPAWTVVIDTQDTRVAA